MSDLNHRMVIRLGDELKERIEAEAKRADEITVAAMCRILWREALAARKQKRNKTRSSKK